MARIDFGTPAGGLGGGPALLNIVEDLSPQLGGNLDLNGNVIPGLEIGVDIQAFSSVLQATTASFLVADETKLDGIETLATADQTDLEIKTAYENNANTNVLIDHDLDKLERLKGGIRFDLTNASFSGRSFDLSSQLSQGANSRASAIFISSDGLSMYVVDEDTGGGNEAVYQYNLLKKGDPSSAVFTGNSFDLSGLGGIPTGIYLNPARTKMFIAEGTASDSIEEFNLIAGDVSTASFVQSFILGVTVSVQDIWISIDGLRMYIAASNPNNRIHKFDLPSAFSLTGASDSGDFFDTGLGSPQDMYFNDDESECYVITAAIDTIEKFSGTAKTLSTFSVVSAASLDISSEEGGVRGLSMAPNGRQIVIVGSGLTAFLYEMLGDIPIAYAKRTSSAKQTITAAGALSLAHNMLAQPSNWYVIIECTTAELNYSIGDQVRASFTQDSANNQGVSVVPDGTNLEVRFGSGAGGGSSVFTVINKTTGIGANITNANWKAIFVAEL